MKGRMDEKSSILISTYALTSLFLFGGITFCLLGMIIPSDIIYHGIILVILGIFIYLSGMFVYKRRFN